MGDGGVSVTVGGALGLGVGVDNMYPNDPLQVDAGLDEVKVGNIAGQPLLGQVTVGNVAGQALKMDAGLADIHVKELPTIELRVALTEIPKVRAHVPQHYDLSIRVFGIEIVCFSLCGESQVITEPYVARKPEACR